METRQIIAWAIIAFLVVMMVGGLRFATTSRRRQRLREKREFDRHAAALVKRDDEARDGQRLHQ